RKFCCVRVLSLVVARFPAPSCSTEQLWCFWEKTSRIAMTLIEIRPHRRGWKVFEAPGVEPVFLEKAQAINYAQNRASFRSGEIRILDAAGDVEHTIPFDEADRRL